MSRVREHANPEKIERLLLIGQPVGAAYYGVLFDRGVFTLFLLSLGVREFLLGIMAIIPPALGVLSVVLMPHLRPRYSRVFFLSERAMAVIGFLILPLFLIADRIPFPASAAWCMVFLMLCYGASQIYTLAWFPFIADIVPSERIGRFLGILRFWIIAGVFCLLQVVQRILGDEPGYVRFFWAVLMLACLQTLRPLVFRRIPHLPSQQGQEQYGYRSAIRSILQRREMALYLIYLFSSCFIYSVTGPFVIPYLKIHLRMSASFCLFLSSVSLLGYGLSVFGWGKFNDRWGSHVTLFLAKLYSPVYWLCLAHVHLVPPEYQQGLLTVISFFGGISAAGAELASVSRRIMLSEGVDRFSFLGYTMILGAQLPAIIGAPAGGYLLQRMSSARLGHYSIYSLLFLGAGCALAALLVVIVRMRTFRERPLAETMRESLSEGLWKLREFIVSPP